MPASSRFIFLGDYVGYGADPGFAVDTVMREVERGAVALLGNHDAAIASGTGGMNPVAAEAIEWTRPQLDATQREFLARLPLTFEDDRRLFVHASAHAPEHWEYVTERRERLAQFHGDARASDVLRPRPCAARSFICRRPEKSPASSRCRPSKFRCSRSGAGSR